jgi:hypothetical protein
VWIGVFGICLAFLITCAAPLWSFALAPLILGVPHLLSGARYLILRPGLHRRWQLLLLAGPPLLVAAFDPRVEVGLFAALGAVLASRATAPRKLGLSLIITALIAVAWGRSLTAQLIFLHAHNLVALALWWGWRKRTAIAWLIPALSLAGTAAILLGAAEPLLVWTNGFESRAADLGQLMEGYAPVDSATLSFRLLLTFVFLQSIHYLVWLRLVPEDDRARPAPRTFAASWAALRIDFPLSLLLAFAALAAVIAGWGVLDLGAARDNYLRLAGFHGYLELAVGALWLAEGRG